MTAGPVVVLILSHRDAPLVRRLVNRLTAGSNTAVVVHHDPTGPALELPRSSAVLTMPSPQHAEWGRMSLALTVVNGLRFAVTHIPELSWVLVISGQDYPTRHMSAIEKDLAASTKDAYLRYFRVDRRPGNDEHHWQQLTRRRYLHKIRLPGTHRSVPFPRRHLFDDRELSLYVGDQWVNLRSSAVEHVLEQQCRLPAVARYFNWCSIPDEGYLSTLLLNNAGQLAIEADRRRYISWTKGQNHPALLEIGDVRKGRVGHRFVCSKGGQRAHARCAGHVRPTGERLRSPCRRPPDSRPAFAAGPASPSPVLLRERSPPAAGAASPPPPRRPRPHRRVAGRPVVAPTRCATPRVACCGERRPKAGRSATWRP